MKDRPVSDLVCWCGNVDNQPFSDHYLRCSRCGTLISQSIATSPTTTITQDDKDFYGREYWWSYQVEHYGCPDITQRARLDLPERCLYWTRALLAYKMPPGKLLELGCGHGASVALMKWAGFDTIGLELSPSVVNIARESFDIAVIQGPIEKTELAKESFDAIVLYDVLEHLSDPTGTMARCSQLLKPDGLFLVQTPSAPEKVTFRQLVMRDDAFLRLLQEKEHLYLFTQRAARKLFEDLQFTHQVFMAPIFPYDMFFVASRNDPARNSAEAIAARLCASPSGRLVLALLDLDDRLTECKRQKRRSYIHALGARLGLPNYLAGSRLLRFLRRLTRR